MTNDTLVVYGTVTLNGELVSGEEVCIINESDTKDFMEYTKSDGKYQINCSGFDEGEICYLISLDKKIKLKADSSKTPYRIDIVKNNNVITDETSVVV